MLCLCTVRQQACNVPTPSVVPHVGHPYPAIHVHHFLQYFVLTRKSCVSEHRCVGV